MHTREKIIQNMHLPVAAERFSLSFPKEKETKIMAPNRKAEKKFVEESSRNIQEWNRLSLHVKYNPFDIWIIECRVT